MCYFVRNYSQIPNQLRNFSGTGMTPRRRPWYLFSQKRRENHKFTQQYGHVPVQEGRAQDESETPDTHYLANLGRAIGWV
jgi:hypothetical protein